MLSKVFPLVVAGFVFYLMSCSDSKAIPKPKDDGKRQIKVRATKIEPETFTQKLTLTASARAYREVVIASETAGRVVEINFEKGDYVQKDKPLIRLDDSSLQADIAQARADTDILKLEYQKLKALAEVNAGVSEFKLEQARLRMEAAISRTDGFMARLDKLTIKAPFAGHIAGRDVEVGAIVAPGAFLAKLLVTRPIKVVIGIPESAIADFAVGKSARVEFDAYKDEKYEGFVTYISPEVDRRSRTFELELELPNKDKKILPEMSAKVTFTRKELPNSIIIPQTAIVELADKHAVFIVTKDNVARQRIVEVADSADEMALIVSGVQIGDLLVVKGQRGLMDGDNVEIVK